MAVANKLEFILKQNENNKLSHAFLIETNNINLCLEDLKKVIAIINKTSDYDEKYLENLINIGNLPSLEIIQPDGLVIKKFQMEDLEKKFSTKPIYSKYNNYIIVNADKLNESASNAILKFLEEPEDNIIGFLIVNNKENVLPTIKSRCEIFKVKYDEKNSFDDQLIDISKEYCEMIFNSNDYLVNKKLILSNYNDKDTIEKILLIMFDKYYKSIDKTQ